MQDQLFNTWQYIDFKRHMRAVPNHALWHRNFPRDLYKVILYSNYIKSQKIHSKFKFVLVIKLNIDISEKNAESEKILTFNHCSTLWDMYIFLF